MGTTVYNLEKAHCQDDPAVQYAEYKDYQIGKVTYRVWSAFTGSQNVADILSGLMLRKLESGEQNTMQLLQLKA